MAYRLGERARGRAVTPEAPRLVLDTHVWLDLLLFHDPCVERLGRELRERRVVAVMDGRMRNELVRVLGYAAFALDASRQTDIAREVACLATAVETPTITGVLPRCRDPDDQMFVEIAVTCHASALLSRDDALLRLSRRMRAFGVEVTTPNAWCMARAG